MQAPRIIEIWGELKKHLNKKEKTSVFLNFIINFLRDFFFKFVLNFKKSKLP